MEQVFERFFTTKKKGLGLGLSICRTIIDAHRGKIWATNDADRGATFHFRLPIMPIARSERRQ
jgi:signal transduction histidine kinase